jgi:hypothetical protein
VFLTSTTHPPHFVIAYDPRQGPIVASALNRDYPYQVLVPSWNVRGKMFERVDAFHVQIDAPMKKRSIFKNDSYTSFIALRNGRMLSHFKSCSGVTSLR